MCVPGHIYQECGNTCHRSCRDLRLEPKNCESQCVSGCNCPNGTVLNDYDTCIPITECPCHLEGNSYPAGHVLYKDKHRCVKWYIVFCVNLLFFSCLIFKLGKPMKSYAIETISDSMFCLVLVSEEDSTVLLINHNATKKCNVQVTRSG